MSAVVVRTISAGRASRRSFVDLIQSGQLPALWKTPLASFTDRKAIATGKAKANEPLLEQPPRHFIQQRDPPPVDLDQVVVSAEDRDNSLLSGRRRNRET